MKQLVRTEASGILQELMRLETVLRGCAEKNESLQETFGVSDNTLDNLWAAHAAVQRSVDCLMDVVRAE